MTDGKDRPPILADKHYASASAFTPESLLREARRQKGAPVAPVPKVCLLDPDGDIVHQLKADGRARRHDGWGCYHTDLGRGPTPTRSISFARYVDYSSYPSLLMPVQSGLHGGV